MGRGAAQGVSVNTSYFPAKSSEPLSELIKLADAKDPGAQAGQRLDSLLVVLDDRLAGTSLSPRSKVCHLAVYGQLLIDADRLTEAYRYCRMANDLAVEKLASDDLIRGYAQTSYGMYLDFYQSPELALEPLQQSLVALKQLDPESTKPYRKVYHATLRAAITLGQLADAQRWYGHNAAETFRFAGDGSTPDQWMAGFPKVADPGTGVFDIPAILAAAAKNGVDHYFLGRDLAPQPEATLRNSYANLRGMLAKE